jgi:hypothetical protein
VSHPFHKPSRDLSDPAEVLLGFLDYYRSVIVRKLEGLTETQLRTSCMPSGWTPIQLTKHLVYMERRWLQWGFRGESIADPHGDADEAGRWDVAVNETVNELIAGLWVCGQRTHAIVENADLGDIAAIGGRFTTTDERPPPTLAWILTYVLQEYARHAGHLDAARELADGRVGE